MTAPSGSTRSKTLAARIRRAGAELAACVARVDDDPWNRVPSPGVWSIGKEAEHALDAIALHLWIVGFSVGEVTASSRPTLERRRLRTDAAPGQTAARLVAASADAARRVTALSDDQLALPTKPPRATARTVAAAIDAILVRHLDGHRVAIEEKLRAANRPG